MRPKALTALLAGIPLTLTLATTAQADPPPNGCQMIDGGAQCNIVATDPGSPGGGGSKADPEGSATAMTCTHGGVEIPCSSPDGTWSQDRACYVQEAPASDAASPLWQAAKAGHTDGVVLKCTNPLSDRAAATSYFWAKSAPTSVDPAVVARLAITQMNLHMGTLASNPPQSTDPTVMGLVGYPVWLWISDPGESTTGPITRSATAGSVTVTATANLISIRWSMGDGHTITCNGPGTPWTPTAQNHPSPTCGHTYQKTSAKQPNLQYPVTATATWNITWSGGGQSGSQTITFTATTYLRIGEAQVLITGNGS